jgi:hypothetical protein
MQQRITVSQAADLLNVSPQFIRVGLQNGTLPIGSAVKMSSRWTYHISEHLLEQYTGTKNATCVASTDGITVAD